MVEERRLSVLQPLEQLACRVAELALGVVAIPEDVPPRQGVVDAFLEYPDGRRAAFEVTSLARDGGARFQLYKLLSTRGAGGVEFWPTSGRCTWIIEITRPFDLPRLRKTYQKIIKYCEDNQIYNVWSYAELGSKDDELAWVDYQSSISMRGIESEHPMVTVVGAELVPVMDEKEHLSARKLDSAFSAPHLRRRMEKLLRVDVQERHLFVFADAYDLPASVFAAERKLSFPTNWPDGLTHLWLAQPAFGGLQVITRNGSEFLNFTEIAPA
jgi:hypothetical protein